LPFIVINKKDRSEVIIGFEIFPGEASACGKLLRVIRYDEELMDEPSISPQRVTQLLADWSYGENAALSELTPLVFGEPGSSCAVSEFMIWF
jgi:hypothetical protein